MEKFDLSDYLSFTVIASIIATLGSLFALFLKDFFFIRINENWKEKQTLKRIYKKYKSPLILSSKEIALRFDEISRRKRVQYYDNSVFYVDQKYIDPQDPHGEYFSKYRLTSALYRLCAFLGWLELLRIEITFLETGKNKLDRKIRNQIRAIQSQLSDLHLNKSKDLLDVVIFREEQRAIGEGMISNVNGEKSIIGFGKFMQIYDSFIKSEEPTWLMPAISFFKEIKEENDFRIIRAGNLRDEIIGLISILDKSEEIKMWKIIESTV